MVIIGHPANTGSYVEESGGSRGTTNPGVDSEYTAAMNRLRTTAPVGEGKEKTAVDIYLEKQHAYSVAVSHLEWVSTTNAGLFYRRDSLLLVLTICTPTQRPNAGMQEWTQRISQQ